MILCGYFLGDGCFSDGKIKANTISIHGAFQIYEMLARIKMPCSIQSVKGQNGHHDQYCISLGRPASHEFYSMMDPWLFSSKLFEHSHVTKNQTRIKFSDDYVVSSIQSVEELPYNDLVYNLEVDEDNSYIANGTVVHNCVVALALANWGRTRGLAGGYNPVEVMLDKSSMHSITTEPRVNLQRPRVYKQIYGRTRSSVGFDSMNEPLWGG